MITKQQEITELREHKAFLLREIENGEDAERIGSHIQYCDTRLSELLADGKDI